MKTIYKNFIAILLVFLLVGLEENNNLFAQTFTLNNLKYSIKNGNSVAIIGYSDSKIETLDIDSCVFYNGKKYKVTDIDENAFSYCSSITHVSIPNSVKTIGNAAFFRCIALDSITIPNSVTNIGTGVFADCWKLKAVTIPNGITTIGSMFFFDCHELSSITIPNSVTSIGEGAFIACISLTSIIIPNSVTSIESGAFATCEGLTKVIIQNPNLQFDFEKVFNGCGKLQRSNVVYQSDKTTPNKTTPQNTASKPTSQNTNTKPTTSQATPQPATEFNGEVYQIVEQMPSFPGGDKARSEYISNNLKYPQTAIEKGVQGRVFVGFIVEPDGSISNVKVLRSLGSGCDEEAMRVIKSMPKWEPGKQGGQAVRVNYQIPVNFSLPK